eukprot:998008-Rhodomonas_salina.1
MNTETAMGGFDEDEGEFNPADFKDDATGDEMDVLKDGTVKKKVNACSPPFPPLIPPLSPLPVSSLIVFPFLLNQASCVLISPHSLLSKYFQLLVYAHTFLLLRVLTSGLVATAHSRRQRVREAEETLRGFHQLYWLVRRGRLYTTRAVRCQVLTWYMVVLQTTKGSLTRTRRKGRRGRTLSVSYELLYLLRSVYAVRSRLSYELCATVSGYASITRCPVLTSGVWYGRKRRNV